MPLAISPRVVLVDKTFINLGIIIEPAAINHAAITTEIYCGFINILLFIFGLEKKKGLTLISPIESVAFIFDFTSFSDSGHDTPNKCNIKYLDQFPEKEALPPFF